MIEDIIYEILKISPISAWLLNHKFHQVYEKYINQIQYNLFNSMISNIEIDYMKKILKKLNQLIFFKPIFYEDDSINIVIMSYHIPILHKLINYINKLNQPKCFSIDDKLGFIFNVDPTFKTISGRRVCCLRKIWEKNDLISAICTRNTKYSNTLFARDQKTLISFLIKPEINNWLVDFISKLACSSNVSNIKLSVKLYGITEVDINYTPNELWTGYNIDDIII